MNITVSSESPAAVQCDAIVLAYPREAESAAPWDAVDAACSGLISETLASAAFKGETGRCVTVPTRGAIPAREIVLAGLGAAEELSLEFWRRAVAAGCRVARRRGASRVVVGAAGGPDAAPTEIAGAAAEAALLGCYRFTVYKSPDDGDLEELVLAAGDAEVDETAITRRATVARCACWARDLINESPSAKRPPAFAERAVEMAEKVGLACTVVDEGRAREIGLEALLAVGQGSDAPPRMVVLEHAPEDAPEETVLLVGKGVTFDTGGISIKPSSNMDAMKGDMSGAAAVLATMRAVAELGLPSRVVGIAPMAENMPDGRAYRPGDLVRAYGDKTVEVINTDAEGRMILIDALAWGREHYEPTCIVDLATLTGACIVALGDHVAGLMSNDDTLAEALLASGEATGERLWRLPVFPEYRELIDSKVADVKNSGGRPAGAITAAKFLQEFIGDTPWAHLDIAGPAYASKRKGYRTAGGTGFGVRLLVDWLARRRQEARA